MFFKLFLYDVYDVLVHYLLCFNFVVSVLSLILWLHNFYFSLSLKVTILFWCHLLFFYNITYCDSTHSVNIWFQIHSCISISYKSSHYIIVLVIIFPFASTLCAWIYFVSLFYPIMAISFHESIALFSLESFGFWNTSTRNLFINLSSIHVSSWALNMSFLINASKKPCADISGELFH